MSNHDKIDAVVDLLYREARCLDRQCWADWLDLYVDNPVFWVPAWKSEHEPTSDPRREVSLIYLNSRTRLEERVSRILSGKSAAALVLPRTAHVLSNVEIELEGDERASVLCNCITHLYDPKRQRQYQSICRYDMAIVFEEEKKARIAAKKIILLNDNLPAKLDFYMI